MKTNFNRNNQKGNLNITYFFSFISFHIQFIERGLQRCSSHYTYQQSQQHKTKLISNLLSSNAIRKFPTSLHSNNSYH